jgi:hypothetical protein
MLSSGRLQQLVRLSSKFRRPSECDAYDARNPLDGAQDHKVVGYFEA